MRSGFNPRRGTFEVVVEGKVKKGEQIFIEYGERKDNQDLLINYGFTLATGENQSDKLPITKEDVLQAASDFPNLKQCSRIATTDTSVALWHVYATHVHQVN